MSVHLVGFGAHRRERHRRQHAAQRGDGAGHRSGLQRRRGLPRRGRAGWRVRRRRQRHATRASATRAARCTSTRRAAPWSIGAVSRGVDGASTPCGGGGIYVRTDKIVCVDRADDRPHDRQGRLPRRTARTAPMRTLRPPLAAARPAAAVSVSASDWRCSHCGGGRARLGRTRLHVLVGHAEGVVNFAALDALVRARDAAARRALRARLTGYRTGWLFVRVDRRAVAVRPDSGHVRPADGRAIAKCARFARAISGFAVADAAGP